MMNSAGAQDGDDERCDFVLKMINFVLKMMDFVLQIMNFVFKMMDWRKMLDGLAGLYLQ